MKSTFLAVLGLSLISVASFASESKHTLSEEINSSYNKKFGVNLGAQIPTGVVLELNYRPSPYYSFGLDGGGIAFSGLFDSGANQKGVKNNVSIYAFEGRGRWHPFGGAFLLGMAFGWQNFGVTGINGRPSAEGSLSGVYLAPHLGWMWIFDSGFTIGTEFGVQIPLGARSLKTSGLTQKDVKDAHDALDPYLATVSPYINIIKLGYSF